MSTPIREPEVIQPEKPKRAKKSEQAMVKRESHAIEKPANDVEQLMIEAVRSGNLDVMERVMAIRRELKAEAAKEAFFAAMSAFQQECPVIKRTKKVSSGNFSYYYAPLDQIVKQVGPLIAKHGLSYNIKAGVVPSQKDGEAPRLVARTYVYHEAGHSEYSEFSVPIESSNQRNKIQEMGNSNTYAKRYSFCNAFGILTEDDDVDGGRLTPQQAREAKREVRQPQMTPTAQKAANGSKERVQIDPAEEGKGIDEHVAEGLWKAMQHATLSLDDFKKRFPKLTRLGEIKLADFRVVERWIADPTSN